MANAQVNLVFTADATAAKKQLQDLQTSLSNLTKNSGGNSDIFNLSPSIQKATQAAAQLKATLASATNINTGQLDLSKFAKGLEDSGMSLSKYRQQLEQLGPAGSKAFADVAKSISTAQVPIQKATGLLHDFGVTLKNTAKWQISSTLLHGFMGAVQSAWGYAQDLNESLNNIRIVTGYNIDKMSQFAAEANKAAKALSTTTTNYTDASLIYYQQGLGDKEVKERTDVTVKLANVARESATTVSDQMTAVWNNFVDGSKSLEYYADVITKLGAATAASNSEIAEGIEKFAAISHTVGLSYEYATSALTTVVDRTRQSADVVGTAFKTMFARIQGLKLGETLEDGTTLNQYSQALKAVGINIKESNGELKNMDVILDEMGAKWKDLNRDEQVALAQKVAGVRQYQQLISLMENYDFFKENVDLARNSEGSLQEQADIYAESWEAAKKRVQASMETIYKNLINDEGFIHLTQGLAKVLDLVGDFIKSIGGLKGVLFALGAVAIKVFSQDIAKGIESMQFGILRKTREANKEKMYMQQKENAATELGQMSKDSGSYAGAATADAYKEQSEMQLAIIRNADHLDEAQLSQLNSQMKIVESLHEQVIAAGEVADQAERSVESAESYARALNLAAKNRGQKELIPENTIKTLKSVNTDLGKASTRMHTLNKLGGQLGPEVGRGMKIGKQALTDTLERTKTDINGMEEALKSAGEGVVSPDTLSSVSELANKIEDVKTRLNAIKESDDGTFDGSTEEARELGQQLTELTQQFQGVQDQIQALNIDAVHQIDVSAPGASEAVEALNQVTSGSQQTGEALAKMEETSAGASAGMEKVTSSAKNMQSNASNTQATVNAVGQSIMTLGMVVSTVTSLIDTFMDPDTSGMDKAKALIMGLLGLVPMIIGAVNSISAAVTAGGIAGSLAWLWVTLAVAGVAALVAITISIIQAVSSAPTELEKKTKALEETIDAMKEASENVKSEIEGIKSALDGYDDAVAKLEECTRGTEEWNEALKTVNQSVLDLIREYPELAGVQGAFSYDSSTGMRTINKDVVNDYLDQKQMQANTIDAATMRKEAELAQVRAEGDKESLAKSMASNLYNKQDFSNNDYHTDDYGNLKNYQYTSEIQQRLQDNLLDLSGLDPDQMRAKLEEIFPEESFGDEFIDSLMTYAGDIDNLAATTDAAALQMQTASELVAQSNIEFKDSDYEDNISGAITKMAAGQYDQTYATEYDRVLDTVKGFSRTGQNGSDSEVKALWDEFNKAQGTNYELDKNAIRGNKNKREMAYKEDGEVKTVSADYIASTIATSKALEEMGASADQAREILGKIDFDSDKLNTEINKYLSSGNMAEMSQKDLEALQGQEDLGEYLKKSFGGEENLQAYADMLGKSVDEVIADFENSMSNAEAAFAEAMQGFSRTVQQQFAGIDDEVKKEMNVGQQKQLAELMQQAFDNQGKEASQLVADMFNSFGENADEIITMIQDIDFDTATVSDYEKAISEAGLTGLVSADQLRALAGAIKDLGEISDLAALQANYAERKSITSGLEVGDTISAEDWGTLDLDPSIANQYFTEMADGTHRLIGDAQEFQQIMNQVNLQPFKENVERINAEIDKYAGFEGENTYNTLNQSAGVAAAAAGAQDPEAYKRTFANTQLDYLEGSGYSAEGFDLGQLRDNLSSGTDLGATYAAIAEAIAACGDKSEQFGEKQRENQAEAEKLNEIIEQQEIADMIDASGLDEGLVRDTAKAFEGMSDALEGNEKLATQVALRYLKLQDAVIDLSKNYDDYKDVLTDIKKANNDVDKAAIKNSDSFKGLQKSMAGLLGTTEKFIDADLMEAIDPADLEAASRGDEAAIERIRDAFIELQAEANGIDLDGLKNELAGLKEGEVFDIDNTPFLQSLIEAQLAAGATAEDIQAMLAGMDIDADVTPFEGSMEEMAAASAEAGTAVVQNTSFDQEVQAADVEQPEKGVDISFDETITTIPHTEHNKVLKDGAEEASDVTTTTFEYDKTVVPKVVEEDGTETTPAKSVKTSNAAGKSGNVKGVQIKNAHKSTGSSVSNGTKNTAGNNRNSCFIAGTLVSLGTSFKKIEDIHVGDIVLSYNEQTCKNEYSEVLQTMIHHVDEEIYDLYIEDEVLSVTGIHKFLVIQNQHIEWVAAENLHIGDKVLFADYTWHHIFDIKVNKQLTIVYNFEVANNHNYYVGKNQILAHNKGKSCFKAGTLITKDTGFETIENIKIGDIVLSYNEKTKKNEYSKVLQTMIHFVNEKIYHLHIKDDILKVTGIHKFLILRNKILKWIKASKLKIGDYVLFADGTLHQIEDISSNIELTTVYNFEVSNNHNYYVGKNAILAHNKGGSKGGSSTPAEKKDLTQKDDIVERYKQIKDKLNIVNKNLDKYNKLSDLAYGKNKLKMMNNILNAYKQEIKLQSQLVDKAKEYQEEDKQNLESIISQLGVSKAKYDSDGNISNVEQIEKEAWTKLTALQTKNNELSTKEQQEKYEKETLNPYDKLVQELLKAITKYDSSKQEVFDAEAAELDAQINYLNMQLEMATKKLQIRTDVRDTEIKLFEREIEKLGNQAFVAAKRIAYLNGELAATIDEINAERSNAKYNILHGVYNLDENGKPIKDAKGNLQTIANDSNYKNLSLEKLLEVLSDPKFWETHGITEDAANNLKTTLDSLLDLDDALDQMKERIDKQLIDTFNRWQEVMERNIATAQHYVNTSQTWLDILETIAGRAGTSSKVLQNARQANFDTKNNENATIYKDYTMAYQQFQDSQKAYNKIREDQQKAEHDAQNRVNEYNDQIKQKQNTIDKAKDKLENPGKYYKDSNYFSTPEGQAEKERLETKIDKRTKEIEDLEKEKEQAEIELATARQASKDTIADREEMRNKVRELQEEYIKGLYELIEMADEMLDKQLEETLRDFEKRISGIYGSIEGMQEAFDRNREINNRYLADTERIYELTKLNRDLENKMDQTSNLKAKEKLRDFQKEITKYAAEGVKMSQYDLEVMQKKYDLEVAKIALEEAQNAKTQVRLTRDAEGNYSYTYTADESKQGEAEQNYEDKLNDLIKYNNEYQVETQESILSIQKAWDDAMADLLARRKEFTEEEYYAKLADINAYYTSQMQYFANENEKASKNNMDAFVLEYDSYYDNTQKKIGVTRAFTDEEKANYAKVSVIYQEAAIKRDKSFAEEEFKYKEQQEKIAATYQERLNQLNADLAEGKISEEKYLQEKEKLERETNIKLKAEADKHISNMKEINNQYHEDLKKDVELDNGLHKSASEYWQDLMEKDYIVNGEYKGKIKDGNTGFITSTQTEFLPGLSATYQTATETVGAFADAITDGKDNTNNTLMGQINNAVETNKKNVQDAMEKVGIATKEGGDAWETLEKKSTKEIDLMKKKSTELQTQVDQDVKAGIADMGDSANAVVNWYNKSKPYWDNAKKKIDNVTTAIKNMLAAAADIKPIKVDVDTKDAQNNLKDLLKQIEKTKSAGTTKKTTPSTTTTTPTTTTSDKDTGSKINDSNRDRVMKEVAMAIWYKGTWGLGKTKGTERYDKLISVFGKKGQKAIQDYLDSDSKNNYKNVTALKNKYDKEGTLDSILKKWSWSNMSQYANTGKFAFNTGGYTGKWGSDGRWALLHEKELILNAKDTENMLAAVKTVREIAALVDLQAKNSNLAGQYALSAGLLQNTHAAQQLEQTVHISADFPNVQNHNEIEMALTSLVNRASQYAYRTI